MPSYSDLQYIRGTFGIIKIQPRFLTRCRLIAPRNRVVPVANGPLQELADIEGKSQPWIRYRLVFGQFLNWLDITMVIIDQNKRVSLSERKFRGFWKNTDKSLK